MVFDIFKIEIEEEKFIFLSAFIEDVVKTADDFFNFFFDEKRIFQYFKCLEENCVFEPTKKNYASLYLNLGYFFDSSSEITEEKAGKTGEYFLSILLLEFFKYDCVLPKLIYISDQKMPIYGIDTLFYSKKLDLLLFGEAKFTKDISSGITLINKSLDEYENQFNDEHRFIVNNGGFSKSKNPDLRKFGEASEEAIDFKSFVSKSGITEIGIPLFICHGEEVDKTSIIKNLLSIKKKSTILGLKVKYLIISLPVKQKYEFLKEIKKRLIEKQAKYGRLSK